MLSAAALAALEAQTPPEQRVVPSADMESTVSSADSLQDSCLDLQGEEGGEARGSEEGARAQGDQVPTSTTACASTFSSSDAPEGEWGRLGLPKTSSQHSKGHVEAVNSVEKWIKAALVSLGEVSAEEFVSPQGEPNNALASQVLHRLSEWYERGVAAKDVGIQDPRPHILSSPVPRDNQRLGKAWIRRYINSKRTDLDLPDLHKDWSNDLAGSKACARKVSKVAIQRGAQKGTLFRHKHDFAPSQEELTDMILVGFVGDERVDADVLSALESGMAIAVYLPTGARGAELKKMHFQSLGHEFISYERGGHLFECLKMTAFETKTKEQHLNQMLAHSNPWRCGVGLLGLSILVRVVLWGPPSFSMQVEEGSWKIFGSNASTLDRRLKEVFKVAGVRRQHMDPVTYLGRHFGTRLLQHQGGTTEGGAARRGHGDGKTAGFHYTECPLQDLLRLAGNFADAPFVPAHLRSELHALADAVLMHLFPALAEHERCIAARQREVDLLRGKEADQVRTAEQLCDQERLLRAVRFACRTAVCCLVARPRTWKQWTILEDAQTLWQRAESPQQRVIWLLFAGKGDALRTMNDLATGVRHFETGEILARKASPERTVSDAMVSAVERLSKEAEEREAKALAQQQRMLDTLADLVQTSRQEGGGGGGGPSARRAQEEEEKEDDDEGRETTCSFAVTPASTSGSSSDPPASTSPPPLLEAALVSCKTKHKRKCQEDVVYFSTWSSMADALAYARTELMPREMQDGAKWRIRKIDEGKREDKSRDKQWRCYRALAIAVAREMTASHDASSSCDAGAVPVMPPITLSYEEAVRRLQSRFEGFGAKAHTPLLRALNAEHSALTSNQADVLARTVLV